MLANILIITNKKLKASKMKIVKGIHLQLLKEMYL